MPTVSITYFTHGTTIDNTEGRASGWSDVGISELGKRQCAELAEKIRGREFDAYFCSDLRRAVESAAIIFAGKQVVQDKRLREINYGDMTRQDSKKVYGEKLDRIDTPFPNGESYRDVERRMKAFLDEIAEKYDGKRIAMISHLAPQLALEVLLNGKTWKQAIKEDWRHKKEWKPGWDYILKE